MGGVEAAPVRLDRGTLALGVEATLLGGPRGASGPARWGRWGKRFPEEVRETLAGGHPVPALLAMLGGGDDDALAQGGDDPTALGVCEPGGGSQ